MNKPQEIILHHSLTKDNVVLSDFEAIRRYHIEHNGWKDIGYQRVIEKVSGKIVVRQGRKNNEVGAHCKEQGMNRKSIGVCVVGNYDIENLPQDLFDAVVAECKKIRKENNNPKMPINPHRKYAKYKSCPGKLFPLEEIRKACDDDRVVQKPVETPAPSRGTDRVASTTLRRGDKGKAIAALQTVLRHYTPSLVVDGIFGANTEMAVKFFQSRNSLVVDGIVGPATAAKLASAPKPNPKTVRRGDSGYDVELLQDALGFREPYIDGIFGYKTEEAVNYYQKTHRLVVDGIVGPKTWSKLGY